MIKTPDYLEGVKTIQKKLLGKKLTYKEIYNLMDEIGHDRMGDVLTTYFVAASFKDGFTGEELYQFTKAMVETGARLHFKGIVADKHSTGGMAGTRTTMIVVPIVAAAGFVIPKTSSRAITTPAGTADVMEVLAPVTFSPSEIDRMVHDVGGCIVWGGKLGIAPADDVIIHVEEVLSFESFDKVIISIMAKKVAVGATHLVLDIPVGKTMKIQHIADAEKVARKFIKLGKQFGMEVVADVNRVTQPSGRGIGPALEAVDVLEVLEQKASRPMALEKKALRLAGQLLDLCYKESKQDKDGLEEASEILRSGRALAKFREIVKAQGGKESVSSTTIMRDVPKHIVRAKKKGTIANINNYNLNTIARVLGAPSDKYAGLVIHKRIDDPVAANEPLMTLHTSDKHKIHEALETLENVHIYEIDD